MCLIALAWQAHPDYPLLVAANRDEFHARPTAPARFWEDTPELLAGRDLRDGGSWMGVTRKGRFAALTNVRDPGSPTGRHSRGLLVADFLRGDGTPLDYLAEVRARGADFGGFNLLVSDGTVLASYNNRDDAIIPVSPGLHGLSNLRLDEPWPKVRKITAGLAAALGDGPDPEALLRLLADDQPAPATELPQTGISQDLELLLSACFIRSPQYGTRASTVLLMGHRRLRFIEQSFGPDGPLGRAEFAFDIEP